MPLRHLVAISLVGCYAPPSGASTSTGAGTTSAAGTTSSRGSGATNRSSGSSSGGAATTSVVAAGCLVPTFDAGPGIVACRSAAAFLICSYPGGGECAGLSDDLTTTAACAPGAGSCHDTCTPDQYAVACGQVGPGGNSQWFPDDCTPALLSPGGVGFACCPCE